MLLPALIVAIIASLIILGVLNAEATRTNQQQATETQRPPVPVYQPPAERESTYAEGYQAQAPANPTASRPFTPPPSAEEPQPHEARLGEVYEDPLVQYL